MSIILVLLLCITGLGIIKNWFGAGNYLRHSLKNAALLGPFLVMSLTLGFFIYEGTRFCTLGINGEEHLSNSNEGRGIKSSPAHLTVIGPSILLIK